MAGQSDCKKKDMGYLTLSMTNWIGFDFQDPRFQIKVRWG